MVYASQEAHVPTLGSTPRRRIRLVADGVARFRVDRVVQSGYGTPESGPFILVEASFVSDLPLSRSDAVEFDRLVDSASVLGGLRIRSWPELPVARDAMLAYHHHPGVSTRELLSFAVASRRMEVAGSAANSRARLALLRSRNPLERLRSVL
jgi:Lon protease-like protein